MTSARVVWNQDYLDVARALLAQARKSIALRTFLLESRPRRDSAEVASLVHALAYANNRGVAVRVLLAAPKSIGIRVANVTSAGYLSALGLEVRVDTGGQHGKYLLVDDELAVVGSHNWTSAAFGSSVECSVALRDEQVMDALSDDFDARWSLADAGFIARTFPEMDELLAVAGIKLLKKKQAAASSLPEPEFFAATNLTTLFDDSYAAALLDRIQLAQRSIEVMMFRFSALTGRIDITDTILHALGDACERGVSVRVLLDYDEPDDHLQSDVVNRRALERLKRMGAEVRRDSAKRLLHAKVATVDDDLVFIGSHNWTRKSLLLEGEVSVLIDSAKVGASVKEVFLQEWQKATAH